jgi:AraC-like DNA-binding protein
VNAEYCYPTLKVVYIVRGCGKWRIENKDYDIQKGDVFIFNNIEKRAIHTVLAPEVLTMMFVEFEPRFIWTNGLNIFDSSYLNVFFKRDVFFENRISGDSEISNSVKEIIYDIERELSTKLPEYQQMLKIKVLNLLIILNRHFRSNIDGLAEIHVFNKEIILLMNKVIDYADHHISEELTLVELSNIVHMNSSYLSSLFKKYNGITLFQYILRKRISLAIDYLKNSNYEVLTIAGLCGFNTSANFYKYFKSLTGKTPSDFRHLQQ